MTKKEPEQKNKDGGAAAQGPLEKVLLNYMGDKYAIVPLAASWAKVLRRKEEYRHLTTNEILDIALRDATSGAVTWKQVKSAQNALPPLGESANGTSKK